MALIYDLVNPQELQGFVRNIQLEQDRNRLILSQFLPNDNIDEIEFRITTGTLQDEDAAMVRAWDTEAPIGGRQGVKRILGELPPISKKYRMGEEERLRQRALERRDNTGLVNAIYNDAAKGARSVAARLEMFRGEALWRGSLVINENGFNQTVDFGRDPSHTNVAPGVLWSDHATSTPIQDEQAWIQTYFATNGSYPALAVTSEIVVNHLLLNAQYRSMAAVNGVTPPFLSLAGVNQIRAAYDLPPIVTYKTLVRVNGVATRVIPTDKFIYIPPANEPLGRTFFATTAEALELVGANQIQQDQAPGMVSVVEKTFDPVATWTKTAAIGLPILVNPNLTFCADVA